MPATVKLIGAAAAFGTAATMAYSGVIAGASSVQSHDLTDDFAKQDFTDGKGNIIGRAGHNRVRTVTVEAIFTAATEAAAKALTKVPVEMFDLVVIAGSGIANMIDGTWNYEGGRYNGANGQYHRFTLNLWQTVAAAGPTSLALVTG